MNTNLSIMLALMTLSSFGSSIYASKSGASPVRVEALHISRDVAASTPIHPGKAPIARTLVEKPRDRVTRLASSATSPLPIAGKGMWIWELKKVEKGDARRIVKRAIQMGLTHLYVRSGSSNDGLNTIRDIDRIVPVAHAAGIRVIAWDFPRLIDPNADVRRLVQVLDHRVPGGDVVDGVAADLETPAEGVLLTPMRARLFAGALAKARPTRFKVLVPPKPSAWNRSFYPYDIIRSFDAVAPMDYWIDDDPVRLARDSIAFLKRFGKPIAPIGQAYDPAVDGGPSGAPHGRTLQAFAAQARRSGAIGVSFWSWQHATRDQFAGIAKIAFPDR